MLIRRQGNCFGRRRSRKSDITDKGTLSIRAHVHKGAFMSVKYTHTYR